MDDCEPCGKRSRYRTLSSSFYLGHGGLGDGSQQCLGSHHEAGRTPAALEGFVVAGALGDAGEIAEVWREGLGSLDLLVGGVDGQYHAGIHGHAVDEDGAVPAFTAVAADLGEGESHLFAQHEVERPVGQDVHLDGFAVDVEDGTGVHDVGDGGGHGGLGDGDCGGRRGACYGGSGDFAGGR